MAGFLPVIAAFEGSFGIDQNIGDILRVSYLAVTFANFEQWIVGSARRVGWIEQQNGPKPRTPTGGQLEILALDVVDDRRIRPCQKGRNDEADALAGPRRRKAQDMLGTIVS